MDHGEGGLDLLGPGDVESQRLSTAAEVVDGPFRLLLGADISHEDVGPLGGKGAGHRPAQPARSTGHHHRPVGEAIRSHRRTKGGKSCSA